MKTTNLLPDECPPFHKCLEVTPPKDLKVFTICFYVILCNLHLEPMIFLLGRERNLVRIPQKHDRVVGFDKVHSRYGPVQCIISIVISLALATFLLGHEDVSVCIVRRSTFVEGSTRDGASGGKLLKNVLRVEEFGIYGFRGMKIPADDENFSGDISGQNKEDVIELVVYTCIECWTRTLKKEVWLPQPFQTVD